MYGCDGPWWKFRQGLPEYHGIKLAHDSSVCARFKDVHKVEIDDQDHFLFETAGLIGSGGNSGFQAVNLAAQFGATRILLIGFDMHTARGLHWYGANKWHGANNPADTNLMRWRKAFARAADELRRMNVDVINASSDSALVCFPHKTIGDALAEWGL